MDWHQNVLDRFEVMEARERRLNAEIGTRAALWSGCTTCGSLTMLDVCCQNQINEWCLMIYRLGETKSR